MHLIRSHRRRGFSLVEILVVIVVFTVGILNMIQVFPGGLAILRTAKSNSVAAGLARSQVEAMKLNLDQMPEAILPSSYVWTGTGWQVGVDLNRSPLNLTPAATILNQNGDLADANGVLGPWALFSGPNVARRVIGEGRRIPAPRFTEAFGSTVYGGVLTLQFAPLLARPNFTSEFQVYGANLSRRIVDDITDLPRGGRVQNETQYYVDEEATAMALAESPERPDVVNFQREYRVSCAVRYTNGGGTIVRNVFVGTVVPIPESAGGPRFYRQVDFGTLFAQPGLTFIAVELDTLRVQRRFERTTNFLGNPLLQARPDLVAEAAYQYNVLNDTLGVLLFNSVASTYQERRNRGRFPLTARVDYDVLDWRNIRDDFRVPSDLPFQRKLMLDSLKVAGEEDADGINFTGLDFLVPGNTAAAERRDFVLLDVESGAIVTPSSYIVDKSSGIVRFLDLDNAAANGLTADVVYPGENVVTRINDIRGRSVRAVYQTKGDFSVQVIKATSGYQAVYSSTLGYGQCYIGNTDGFGTGSPRRLYFTLSDLGKKVVISEIWYNNGSGTPVVMEEQDFIINADPVLGLGYIDLTEKDPSAVAFDFSRGYSVRGVRGASVVVRAFWNPSRFTLSNDNADNMRKLDVHLSQVRRTSTETFLMPEAQEE